MVKQLDFSFELPEPQTADIKTCASCDYIHAVRFQNKNLFFCNALKGGDYGKKIKKSALQCRYFKKAEEEKIPQIDGHYGTHLEGVKR
jgi:GDP-D-mannose dehydratase